MELGKSTLNVITPVSLGYYPAHPIVLPPDEGEPPTEPPEAPSDAHPEHPIYYPPEVSHPIVLPPEDGGEAPELPETPGLEAKVGWTAETGWVVVYVPTGDHVAPSRR